MALCALSLSPQGWEWGSLPFIRKDDRVFRLALCLSTSSFYLPSTRFTLRFSPLLYLFPPLIILLSGDVRWPLVILIGSSPSLFSPVPSSSSSRMHRVLRRSIPSPTRHRFPYVFQFHGYRPFLRATRPFLMTKRRIRCRLILIEIGPFFFSYIFVIGIFVHKINCFFHVKYTFRIYYVLHFLSYCTFYLHDSCKFYKFFELKFLITMQYLELQLDSGLCIFMNMVETEW